MTDERGGSGDSNWPRYFATVLEIRDGALSVSIDLRTELSADSRSKLLELSDSQCFGVVTAANPFGHECSGDVNRLRLARLRADLVAHLAVYISTDGVSPDGSHREAGFAVWAPREYVRSLAERFDQTAFFWFDGMSFWLVATSGVPQPIRLPPEP